MPLSFDECAVDHNPEVKFDCDPRGCCWPWGSCGRRDRLSVRYTAVGIATPGPVDPDWGRVATGQVLQMRYDLSDFFLGEYHGNDAGAELPDRLYIYPVGEVEGDWVVEFEHESSLIVVESLSASLLIPAGNCARTWDLPVTFTAGFLVAPDAIRIHRLEWYQDSPYPFLPL